MAYEEALKRITLPAAADLSARQYRFVTLDANGRVAVTGAGANADGVLQNKPDAQDEAGTVAIGGVSKIEYGGTVTAGDDLASDAEGRAVTATTGDVVNGRAVEGGASGEIGSAYLNVAQAEPLA